MLTAADQERLTVLRWDIGDRAILIQASPDMPDARRVWVTEYCAMVAEVLEILGFGGIEPRVALCLTELQPSRSARDGRPRPCRMHPAGL